MFVCFGLGNGAKLWVMAHAHSSCGANIENLLVVSSENWLGPWVVAMWHRCFLLFLFECFAQFWHQVWLRL